MAEFAVVETRIRAAARNADLNLSCLKKLRHDAFKAQLAGPGEHHRALGGERLAIVFAKA